MMPDARLRIGTYRAGPRAPNVSCVMATPGGYLRAFDNDIDGALQLVVHDLVATRAFESTEASRVVWEWAERCAPGRAGGEAALWVIDHVQDEFHEAGRYRWPACPSHPNHCLWMRPALEPTARWTCDIDGEAVADLG